MIGYLMLFATTGGALAWLAVFLYASKGVAQKSIALLMIVIDLIGEFAIFTVDTIMNASNTGMVTSLTPDEIQTTVLFMSLLIAVNIAAVFAYHIMDMDNMEELEEKISDWHIDREVRTERKSAAKSIAKDIAMREAEKYKQEQYAKDRSKTSDDVGLLASVKELFGENANVTKENAADTTAPSFPDEDSIKEKDTDFEANNTDLHESQDGGKDGGFYQQKR